MANLIVSGSDFIKVNISNSKNDSVAFEMKYPKSLTVAELKSKLEIVTGGNAGTMRVEAYNGDHLVAKLSDDSALLGSLPIDSGMRLHVIDSFSLLAEDDVVKFELSDQHYEQKDDTVRSFLKKNRMGKYNDEEMLEKEKKLRQLAEEEKQRAELCTVGSRCEVKVAGNPTRRGTIMFNGPVEGKRTRANILIGIKYDEPLGKNNGSLDGKSYFVCPPNYGGFVSPLAVTVGDFPVEAAELDDEI